MKLFVKREKVNRVTRLISNLEKITKIAILRIEKDYTNSVIEDLKWIQESFISILKINETNNELFKSLIDAKLQYRKVSFQSLDFDDFSFTILETPFPAEENIAPDKFEKLYDSFDNPDNTDDIILKYIQSIFSIWEAANQKNNLTVQKYAVYIYTNWVYILERQFSEVIDFQLILKAFLRVLGSLNIFLLELEGKKQNPLLSTLNYSIYLNKIFSDDVKYENLDMYFQFLFDNLYQAARLDNYAIINQFIERCINGNYDPSNFGIYTKLYTLLDKKLSENGINDNQVLLKKISEFGFYKLRYLRNYKEHKDWLTSYDAYFENEIFTKIEVDDEIRSLIESQKKLALKCLKYNLLQLVVLKLLAFSLFRSYYTNIKYAFDFNQPWDSNAVQGNKEIMPTSLFEILNYVDYSYSIEQELLSYWQGHHGIEFYLHTLFIYTFYRYNTKKQYHTEDPIRLTKAFCLDVLLNDPGRIEGLKSKIERLKTDFDYLRANESRKVDLFNNKQRVENTFKLFNDIINSASKAIEHVEKNTIIKEETKNEFLQNVIQEYAKYNFMLQLFKLYGNDEIASEPKKEYFGVNELVDRSAFLDNWHIPYIGIIESLGKTIAERENMLGISALYETIKDENKIEVNLDKLIAEIDKHKSNRNIIVGKNIYFYSLFRENKKFVEATNDTLLIKNCHVGFYNGMPVFNFYDRIFEDKSILIIDKKDLYSVQESTVDNPDLITMENFSASFFDYLNDSGKFTEFIDNPNSWLIEQLGEDKAVIKAYLEKFVWIRVLKCSNFFVSSEKGGVLYNIE